MMNNNFQKIERVKRSFLNPRKRLVTLLLVFLLIATTIQTLYVPPQKASAATVVLVGAGDIASCSYNTDEATAKLLDNIPGMVFTTGDNVYTHGTYAQFLSCFHPTWGRHAKRMRPVPGNHEYLTAGAAGYYRYFFGYNPYAYYAYDLGDWRIYALNSSIDASATSAQVRWLTTDLIANPHKCVLAYWHYPRWSSGSKYGNNSNMQALWKALYDNGAEVVLNGHEHHYERFKQMNASGSAVSSGLREFVVGTGGASLYGFGTVHTASAVRNSSTHGVLKLTLTSTSYSWKFVPVAGKTFTDSGTTNCR
jgi:acid phosphatase type 7